MRNVLNFTLILINVFFRATSTSTALDLATSISKPLIAIPFQVSIQYSKTWHQYRHRCFGTIIHEQIMLTAAHCFPKHKDDPKDFTVVAGGDILKDDCMENRYNVTKIIKHDHYHPLQGHDIALLKIKSPLKLDGKYLNKINYNCTKYLEDGQQGYAIGRNHIDVGDAGGSHGAGLKLIPHRTIDNKKCRRRKFVNLTRSDLCAVAYQSSGPCDGDSGGPLVDRNLKLQWGLLSYSRSVCKPHRIYVFTRVQPFIDWIQDTMILHLN